MSWRSMLKSNTHRLDIYGTPKTPRQGNPGVAEPLWWQTDGRLDDHHVHRSCVWFPCTVRAYGDDGREPNPFIPPSLSPASVKNAGFHGPVLHSSRFSAEVDGIMREIPESPPSEKDAVSIMVVSGGKSAQETVVQMPA
ncbi:hypothetical protein JB92DRAFT_3299935 [Gautieria morchelliformis]|nr:hypothetical protein JB92DRAFT_3299935 [Gautieria morchelliformis]